MGTNFYYHEEPPCATCGHCKEPKHIGKSSAGWHFSLHIYPEDGINTFEDWQGILMRGGGCIVDEYGDQLSAQEMIERMTDRSREKPVENFDWSGNDAQTGYNNMIQHKIGYHCAGHHPELPVDYIKGYFS